MKLAVMSFICAARSSTSDIFDCGIRLGLNVTVESRVFSARLSSGELKACCKLCGDAKCVENPLSRVDESMGEAVAD